MGEGLGEGGRGLTVALLDLDSEVVLGAIRVAHIDAVGRGQLGEDLNGGKTSARGYSSVEAHQCAGAAVLRHINALVQQC